MLNILEILIKFLSYFRYIELYVTLIFHRTVQDLQLFRYRISTM